MAAAFRLARWNRARTSTNPSVGCIIVRDGAIVGTGVTALGGRPHAEPQALADAGELARGATAYVTLEPCSHHGRTPPCADALIAYGIARVVIAITDPDPRVSGRGVAMLREAGIAVETGVLEAEGRAELAPYLTRQIEKRAHVTLKLAVSADGMIGRRGLGQVSITGPLARAQVHAMRAEMDAILVGSGTAVADDPELTVRLPGLADRSPRRFVLGGTPLPAGSKLLRGGVTVVSFPVEVAVPPSALPGISPTGGEIDSRHRPHPISPLVGEMSGRTEGGSTITPLKLTHWITPTLHTLLTRMADEGISSLMIEGGASVARAFLEAGLVDRIALYEGPGTIGADGLASPLTRAHMPSGYRLVRSETFGPDRAHHYERET